ncbi:NADH:flavorubredoxin reductase NorW [Shewanella sp. Choline-02u-19]|uniref:NADH:flavorubredoxin reductase NorW n=1 Tax=unclassified Shewanella TaxID=196818 RepID=UPI000C32C6B9|nr:MULTISPECIES: NADH:flavorubredoxin reductase NorW [unclassified Shewanella]PKH54531.1 NADH:flavorubredoxin reductase NorW [Shewanella sp. Bg11-22]PKI28589.1 NADH:flavorubredoxin reductase NorW [Shewanella sp. Choline-02u-19]
MTAPIVIIGSGFAAYQLIKNIRRQDVSLPIQVFTADEGDEYNKPDLSHVFSKQQDANALITLSAADFAAQYQVELFANTRVEQVDTKTQSLLANGQSYQYSKLVFATGATTFVPPIKGDAAVDIVTLNSLSEYRASQKKLTTANRILIMGGGLIGAELAMDLQTSGKKVIVVEPNSRLLANVAPDFVALKLEQPLRDGGMTLELNDYVTTIEQINAKAEEGKQAMLVTTKAGKVFTVDCVISAAGLRPNTDLAQQAGIKVNRGIVVDEKLQSSANNVYALGDCAEINGKVMAYLQPIILSANALAKQLLGQASQLTFPAMMVKVKTPSYPIQVGGRFNTDSSWKVGFDKQGVTAEAYDDQNNMTGFVVTNENAKQAFSLLRKVSAT